MHVGGRQETGPAVEVRGKSPTIVGHQPRTQQMAPAVFLLVVLEGGSRGHHGVVVDEHDVALLQREADVDVGVEREQIDETEQLSR
jgi:hypothetical protein